MIPSPPMFCDLRNMTNVTIRLYTLSKRLLPEEIRCDNDQVKSGKGQMKKEQIVKSLAVFNASTMFKSLYPVVLTACCIFLVLPEARANATEQSQDKIVSVDASSYCPSFSSSSLFRSPDKVSVANPGNWIQAVENAVDGEEILLEDGIYQLNQYAVVFNSSVTIRGASGNRDSVVIQGKGYGENAEALMIMADDVHIADLTVKDVRDHGITIQEGFSRPVIYNVDLVDIGTQHIKGNKAGPGGVIACSRLGYSQDISTGDYNSAIDLHAAVEWTIRDNTIYNIYGDGSECVVDTECGTMFPGGEPAILLWRDSRDNIIERNTIVESFRAISLGLDTPYSGGIVRDNFICRSQPGKEGVNGFIAGDAGISLLGASNVEVRGNRVILAGDYPGTIEIRDGKGHTIVDNILSKPVWNRGDAEYNGCSSPACNDEQFGNIIDANTSEISCPAHDTAIVIALAPTPEELPDAVTTVESENESTEPESEAGNTQVVADGRPLLANKELDAQESLTNKEKGLVAMEQRLLAFRESLKAKEERLKLWEQQLVMEERIRTVEVQQASTQFQIDLLVRRLNALEAK